jgi:hypothetical protein
VRVGEQPAVDDEHRGDRRLVRIRGGGALDLSAQQLEQRQRRVVERDDHRLAHPVVAPQRLDEVCPLECRVVVAAGLVRVALAHRLHVQARADALAEQPVDLRPAVGAVREARQHGEPYGVGKRPPLTGDALEDLQCTRMG